MSLTLTYTFASHVELAAHLARFTGTVDAGVSAPAPAPKPEKAKAAAPSPSPAPAAAATQPATKTAEAVSQTASTSPAEAVLEYDRDVRPLLVKVGAVCGRDAAVKALQPFNAAKGTEVKPSDLPALKASLESLLAGAEVA